MPPAIHDRSMNRLFQFISVRQLLKANVLSPFFATPSLSTVAMTFLRQEHKDLPIKFSFYSFLVLPCPLPNANDPSLPSQLGMQVGR